MQRDVEPHDMDSKQMQEDQFQKVFDSNIGFDHGFEYFDIICAHYFFVFYENVDSTPYWTHKKLNFIQQLNRCQDIGPSH